MEKKILDICKTVNPKVPDNVNILLFDEGYIDSFGAYAILAQLELEFCINILESEFNYDNFKTVGNILELVKRKRAVCDERNKR